jgi:glutathione S-transferase
MELGYWGIKGRAEAIRLELAYLNLAYNEVNPTSPAEVAVLAEKHHLDFPNLPYLVDGDYHLTESLAIPLYIASKAGNTELFGKIGKDQAIHQMIVGVLQDFNQSLYEVYFSADYVNLFEQKLGFFNKKLKQLSEFLGQKQFFLGYVTYSDFLFYSYIHGLQVLIRSLDKTSAVESYANLDGLIHRVSQLDGVREFLASDPRNKLPFLPQSLCKLTLKD